jgi:prepilin peptidase CpaA
MTMGFQSLGAPEIVALAIGVAACVTDLRSRRIPNWLTFGAAVAAMAFAGIAHGLSGLGYAAAGWAVGCLLFLPWFLLGGMGAGDVKLLAALGAWLGPWDAVWVALYAAIAGGVLAIVVSLAGGYLRQLWSNLWSLLMFWRVAGIQPMPSLTLRTAGGPRLPYALPITAGAVAMIWLR